VVLLAFHGLATAPVKWEDWKHRLKELDSDAALVKGLAEASESLTPATPLESTPGGEKLSKLEQWEQTSEEKALGERLRAELAHSNLNRFGRWGEDASQTWLGREAKLAKNDLAFGVVTQAANTIHLGLVKHW